MAFRIAALIVMIASLLLATPALAQRVDVRPQCNDRQSVLRLLARKYQEAPVASGVTNNGGLVEVLTDANGGSWTIIVTTPRGLSCLVAAGEAWRAVAPVPLGPRT